MTKSFCHFDTIPSDLMDIIEADLTEKFDPLMGTSKLMGNVTNTKKRNSRNAWIPTSYWLCGLMWHYFKKANDEFFHYDLECIDGEAMQYTQYELNQHYDWHQDEGLNSMYKPQASGNRTDELILQDYINKHAGKMRKLVGLMLIFFQRQRLHLLCDGGDNTPYGWPWAHTQSRQSCGLQAFFRYQ